MSSTNLTRQSVKTARTQSIDAQNVLQGFKILPTEQTSSRSGSRCSQPSKAKTAPCDTLIATRKENSMVRFDKTALAKKPGVDHRYLPHVHRQKTAILPKSGLLENLEELNSLLPEDISDRDSAEVEAIKILNKFIPSFKNVSNLDLKTFYFIENEAQFQQEPRTLYCILPFKYDSAHVKHLDPGYVTFKLPKVDTGKNDLFKSLRSDEGTQLSPLKFQSHFEQLFTKTIDKLVKARRKVRFVEKSEPENTITIPDQENEKLVTIKGETGRLKPLGSLSAEVPEAMVYDGVPKDSEAKDAHKLIENSNEIDNQNANMHYFGEMSSAHAPMLENKTTSAANNPDVLSIKDDLVNITNTSSERRILQNQNHRISVAETCETVNFTIKRSEEPRSPRIKWMKLVDKVKPLTLKLECDWLLEIVPAIFKSSKEPVYVTKPYTEDANPSSDLRWRICYAKREAKILMSIGKTDKELRLATIKLVTLVLKCDTRLHLLDEYQIQTCLLHEMDDCVDENPRWQRQTLEPCFKALIDKVYIFISEKTLPHFFIPDFNLLENWTASDYDLAKSALKRIASSDIVLCNSIQKCIGQMSSSRQPSPPPSSLSACSTEFL